MRILIRILALFVLFIVLVVAAGFLLPARFEASRSTVIATAPDKIWPLLEDPRAWKRWTVWNRRDPAMEIQYSGAARGAGAIWSWRSRSEGDGRMSFVKAEPPHELTYQLEFSDSGPASYGELRLEAEGNSTRVIWSMSGEAGWNPLARWFGVFANRAIGPDFEAGLANLKQLAETGV